MGTTVTQSFQDYSHIKSGTVQQRIHAIALSALEMIASQLAIVFQMADDRFNRLAAFKTLPDPSRNPSLLH